MYEGRPIDAASINYHLLNGVVALIDLWVSGIPIKFMQFIYPAYMEQCMLHSL